MSKLPELNQHCGNCRFYGEHECHRYAPRPKMFGEFNSPGTGEDEITVWPTLDEDDWCGEWEAEK